MTKLMEDFYNAYWYLSNIKDGQYLKGLEVEVVKVNPDTKQVSSDESKNTEVNIWLETGLFNQEVSCYEHDITLDCGGRTFEEALINLANKIKEK